MAGRESAPSPRRSVFLSLGLLAPLLLRCGDEAPRPNLVLVVIDTLRADHTSLFDEGRDTTPNLARLAAHGVVFERAWSQAPWTLPSMTSLFTGRYVLANYASIPTAAPHLAERLRAAGYDTAAVVANPLLLPEAGFARGFASYEVAEHRKGHKTMRAPDVARLAAEALGRLREPFFLWVHLFDPHFPYDPPRRLRPRVGAPSPERVRRLRERQPAGAAAPIDEDAAYDIEQVIAAYDGEVRFADEALGDVLAEIERSGALGRTVVAVTSDHGEGLFEHAAAGDTGEPNRYGLYVSHGEHLYEEALHVPLVLFGPGFGEGARRRDLAANLDLYATFLALAGEEDPGAHGRDLRRPTRRDALFAFGTRAHAVRTDDDWKLIHPVRPVLDGRKAPLHRLAVDTGRPVLLFHLAEDPRERRDLAGREPERVRRLTELLRRWEESVLRALPDTAGPGGEMRRRLRELGYTR